MLETLPFLKVNSIYAGDLSDRDLAPEEVMLESIKFN